MRRRRLRIPLARLREMERGEGTGHGVTVVSIRRAAKLVMTGQTWPSSGQVLAMAGRQFLLIRTREPSSFVRSLFPGIPGLDVREQEPNALVVRGIEPQHPFEHPFGLLEAVQAPQT
jgi:hypothetical protein